MSLKMDNRDVAGKANRWFGVAPPKSGKMNMNILHQEELIAQKKREIEARMEQKAKQNQVSSPQPPHPGEIANAHNSSVSNKFANDGSFLQQFLKLQKAQTSTDTPPSVPSAPPRVLPRAGKRPPLISSPLGQVKNYMHAKQLPLASRPSVFQSPDEDEEEDYEQWLEIKGKVRELLSSFHHSLQLRRRTHGQWGDRSQEYGVLGTMVRGAARPPG
uniref:SURP and G-patch domain containing 1 n=1 Tax=Rousettus aegyptiacus TaxID=9407 RepID=A0A7J8BMU7_ROUAE|nr:hypothetical protein HJG63_000115 [Rousettus aegyptiacus]